jgi:hypothetical protein
MSSDSSLETSGTEDGESCEFASSGTHDAFNFGHPFRFSKIALWKNCADAYLVEERGWRSSIVGISVAAS